jgi:hypothetical protein
MKLDCVREHQGFDLPSLGGQLGGRTNKLDPAVLGTMIRFGSLETGKQRMVDIDDAA